MTTKFKKRGLITRLGQAVRHVWKSDPEPEPADAAPDPLIIHTSLDVLLARVVSKGHLPIVFRIRQDIIWDKIELASKLLSPKYVPDLHKYEQVHGAQLYTVPQRAFNYGIAIREYRNRAGGYAIALYATLERTTRDGPTTYVKAGYIDGERAKRLAAHMDERGVAVVRVVFNQNHSGYYPTLRCD